MKFTVARDELITPLNQVAGVVERRQTLPILANVLMVLEGERLSLTGTDLEVELIGRVAVASADGDGEVTVPARKLVDICKSLPEGSDIQFSVEEGKVTVKSGRSRFTLSTLPPREFPALKMAWERTNSRSNNATAAPRCGISRPRTRRWHKTSATAAPRCERCGATSRCATS